MVTLCSAVISNCAVFVLLSKSALAVARRALLRVPHRVLLQRVQAHRPAPHFPPRLAVRVAAEALLEHRWPPKEVEALRLAGLVGPESSVVETALDLALLEAQVAQPHVGVPRAEPD